MRRALWLLAGLLLTACGGGGLTFPTAPIPTPIITPPTAIPLTAAPVSPTAPRLVATAAFPTAAAASIAQPTAPAMTVTPVATTQQSGQAGGLPPIVTLPPGTLVPPAVTTASASTGPVAGTGTTCPTAYPIKGNDTTKIYHVPGQREYVATNARNCFATEQAAQAAGYRRSQI